MVFNSLRNQKMSISFALQAFSDNSIWIELSDLSIINVDHKIRTLWKWEKLKLVFIISIFFFLFSINSLANFFCVCVNDKYLPHEDLFQCDTIRQDGLTF